MKKLRKHFSKLSGFCVLLLLILFKFISKSHTVEVPTELQQRDRQEKNSFRFVDISQQAGVDFAHEDPQVFDPSIVGQVRFFYAGAGVGVADVNGDGWMDIFLLSPKKGTKSRLYLNQKGKGFRDEAEAWGVAELNSTGVSISPVFFDYDNDGRPDLFIARMGSNSLFHNAQDHFENVTQRSGLGDGVNSVSATPFDLNHDGYLDLYIIRYFQNRNYFNLMGSNSIYPNSMVDSTNSGVNSVYLNQGDGTFKEVTQLVGGADRHWSLDAVIADFNQSGQSQIYVTNDFGPDSLFLLKNGKIENITEKMGVPDRRFGMGASLVDLDGSGSPFIWVSNEWLSQYEQTGNFLLKIGRDFTRNNYASQYHVENCGWAWGSAFADFDLDGNTDFYVANGFISGKNKRDLAFSVGTQNAYPGIVSSDAGNWPKPGESSFSGHQTGCVFMNRGSYFENAASWASPNKSWDGRAVSMIDFDNSGAVGLVITVQDGPAHLFKNEVTPGRHWIGFKLVGTTSNRDAAGAVVQISQEKWKAYRWVTGGRTGFLASSDPRMHFGLPTETAVDIKVSWPSGLSQTFAQVTPGQYYLLKEGDNSPHDFYNVH